MLHADRQDLQTSRCADRIDQGRYRLPPPRPVASGGKIFTMALAAPGVMPYPDQRPPFSKLVPAEVLSDPEWLASFVGVPIIDDDQDAHALGVDTSTIQHEAIGRMIRAWWDEQQQVVLGEGVIDIDRGLRAIASGTTGVSPAYPSRWFDEVGESNGQGYTRIEVQRLPTDNVAITLNPRGVTTHLQPDAIGGRKMNPFLIDLLALAKKHGLTADAEGKAADPTAWAFDQLMRGTMGAIGERDAMKAECDAMKAKMADMIPKPKEKTPEEEAAEADAQKAADAVRLKDTADALTLADAFQVAPEDRAKGLAHLQRAIVAAAKLPADGLSADSIRGILTGLRMTARPGNTWEGLRPLTPDAQPNPNAHLEGV